MKVPFSPPDIGEDEIKLVSEALRSGWITTGPKTKEFEEKIAKYCNTSKAVCLNSATACLEMTLHLLGIGEGDEVITSAYTYTASASVIHHVGAKIVLVDTQKDSFEMDYKKLEEAISEKTKAIIPVELGGIICDYEKIYEAVENKKDIFVANNKYQEAIGRVAIISDSAHSFGSMYKGKKCGEMADFTCFSFHAVKNLTTAEGGAVTWKDIKGIDNEEIYRQFMILTLHGQTKDALAKTKIGSWEYDILYPAYKCNMTDIMASIGLAQLERYDAMLKRRRELIVKYNKALENKDVITLNHLDEKSPSSCHLYLVKMNNKSYEERNEIIEKLGKKGIATNVHYKPLPLLTAYKNLGFSIDDYPNAFNMFKSEITLPLYSIMEDEQIDYVIEEFIKEI